MSIANHVIQTIPPAGEPDRVPDVLVLDDALTRSLSEIGALLTAADDTSLVELLRVACADGRVDPRMLHVTLVLLLQQFVAEIRTLDDAADDLVGDVVALLVGLVEEESEPVPGWYVPAPRVDLGAMINGGQTLEGMAEMLLAAALMQITQPPTRLQTPDTLEIDASAIGLSASDLERLIDPASGLETSGRPAPDVADPSEPVQPMRAGCDLVMNVGDLAFSTVYQWALEFMDDTVPGLARAFLENALLVRIPRGDLRCADQIRFVSFAASPAPGADEADPNDTTHTDDNTDTTKENH